MEENAQEQIMHDVVSDLVNQYRQSRGEEQAALREIASKVYAEALRNTENVSDITLNVKFGALQRIASSADFSTNVTAVGRAMVEPMVQVASTVADTVTQRAEAWQENPLLAYAKMTAGPILNQMVNPSANVASAQQLVANVTNAAVDVVDKPFQAAARAINFPTDRERERLAAIYDLPYEQRIQALHGVTLEDTATMVSVGSMPGLFPKAMITAKESVQVTKEALTKQIDNLPIPVTGQMPVLATAGVGESLPVLTHIVMASKAGDITPASSSTDHATNAEFVAPVSGSNALMFNKIPLKEIDLKPMSAQLADGRLHEVPIKLHIRAEDMTDPKTGMPRDFDGMNQAILGLIQKKVGGNANLTPQSLMHKVESIDNAEIYFRGPGPIAKNYRKVGLGDGQNVDLVDTERVIVVLYGKNSNFKSLEAAPLQATITQAYIHREANDQSKNIGSEAPFVLTSKALLSNLEVGKTFLEKEADNLRSMQQTLTKNQVNEIDASRLSYLNSQGVLHQSIVDDISFKTKGYPERAVALSSKYKVTHTVDFPEGESDVKNTKDRPVIDDPRNLPNVLKPGQQEMSVSVDEKNFGLRSKPHIPVDHTIEMASMALPQISNGSYIPSVNFVASKEMLQQPLTLQIRATKHDLYLEGVPNVNRLAGLQEKVIDLVHNKGGHGGYEMSEYAKRDLTGVTMIHLGTRKLAPYDVGVNTNTSAQFSDERFVLIAHMRATDGTEIKPIVFSGGIHRPGMTLFDKGVERGVVDPKETYVMTGRRLPIQRLEDELIREMETLSENAKFYSTGGIPQSRHEVDFKAPSPNIEQQTLYTRRYVELEAVLNELDKAATRYLSIPSISKTLPLEKLDPPEVSHVDASVSGKKDEPLASASSVRGEHPIDYLNHETAREIVLAQINQRITAQQPVQDKQDTPIQNV